MPNCTDALRSSFLLHCSLFVLSLASLAGCSSAPQGQRYVSADSSGIDPKYGVRASPRVVADGEEVPKGGGGYMVGKPYKIAGKTYYPSERPSAAQGAASWYGSDFHGRRTANGEVFDRNSISAAHPTMPLPSYARVTNLRNSRSMVVRVNDRGPYHGGRVMDVSQRVAEALDFRSAGTAQVKVEWLGRADLAGDNDAKLLATLRDDGAPASLDGMSGATVMTAMHEAPARTAALAPAPPQRPKETETYRTRDTEMTAYAPDERGENIDQVTTVASTHTESAKTVHQADDGKPAPLPPARPYDLDAHGAGAKHALN